MTKKQLIDKVNKKFPHLSMRQLEQVVDLLLTIMKNSLAKDERIEIRGFGSFKLSYWGERYARNPLTGESWRTKPQKAIQFKPGKVLRDVVAQCSKIDETFESES